MRPDELNALQQAVEVVGDRWTLLVVRALLDESLRFGELQSAVPDVSTNVLSQRLKHLEAAGLVLAVPYQRRPLRFSYALTARGRELGGVLRLLAQWGSGGDADDAVRHDVCGTAAEARWWCPTCERVVDDETTELHHL